MKTSSNQRRQKRNANRKKCYYFDLTDACLGLNISRKQWSEFIKKLRHLSSNSQRCHFGACPGKIILRAWWRETRVQPERVIQIAKPVVDLINQPKALTAEDLFRFLRLCRGAEANWGAPIATLNGAHFVTVTSVDNIFRYYLGFVPPEKGTQSDSGIKSIFQKVDQHKLLLEQFPRPLGQRGMKPSDCSWINPFHAERFDMLWAVLQEDFPTGTADDIRNTLGLVHFKPDQELVCFRYSFSGDAIRMPTVIEAMGDWAFWPAESASSEQRTVNYNSGNLGPREFVHAAKTPATEMQCEWLGLLKYNWDT